MIWLEKARRYCTQQERCAIEIQRKLKEWGCAPEKIPAVIKQLEKDKYFDEQRFANSFARGKFRIKGWGKLKIMAALFQLKVPQALINNALNDIDEQHYRQTLQEILEKKWKITKGETSTRLNKTASYAIGKGYESSLVFEILRSINKT